MSESRELASYDDGRRAITAPRATSISAADRLSMMREAMTNPAVDASKAREMLMLIREVENDERQAQFNTDKGNAIRAMPAIFKRGASDKHRYAKFEDMHRAVMPVLARHNLTLDFRIGNDGNNITVQPLIRHDNGFVEEGGVMKGPADTGPGRSAIQSIGSASSYLKRYSMKAMLNLIEDGEDDDGMGVARPDYQLNNRQESLIVDAQLAADRSEYEKWYGRQNTKDKAILVGSGTHARLGGAPLLPGAQTVDQQASATRQKPDGPDISKPGGWTEQYEIDCGNAPDLNALERVQAKAANALAKLKAHDTTLWQRAIDAGSAAHDRLNPDGETR